MEEICRQKTDWNPPGRVEGETRQYGIALHLRHLVAKLSHLPRATILVPTLHVRIPSGRRIAVRVANALPGLRLALPEGVNQIFLCGRHGRSRMCGRQKNDMLLNFAELRRFPIQRPMSAQEDQHIEGDNREGHIGPTAARHVLVV